MRVYGGIGSRETPDEVLARMRRISHYLMGLGYHLHSGGAKRADTAFAEGVPEGRKTIFIASDATPEALALAAEYHPAWERCSEYARRLHARNGFIVLGRDLKTPVEFIVCWTPGGKVTGGTGQALRIAEAYAIPVFNLWNASSYRDLYTHLKQAA